MTAPHIDGALLLRWLAELATIGGGRDGGVTRLAYTDADRAGMRWVADRMRALDLAVHIDAAGNLIGRREGTDADAPVLLVGSHVDTVPAGGRFDGALGVLAALAAVEALGRAGVRTRHPVEVVSFQNEEGGLWGSHLMTAAPAPGELDVVAASGLTIRDGIAAIGGDPSRLDDARRRAGDVHAYLELHIEQGAVLERTGDVIGVVEGIVGIRQWRVTVEGEANHAGTTAMPDRRDALLAAARFVDAVRLAAEMQGGAAVATVGGLIAHPGATNVIAGRVECTLDLRDLEGAVMDALFARIEAASCRIAEATGTVFRFDRVTESAPAPTHPVLRRAIAAAAEAAGVAWRAMPSGAGHDAQRVARIAPVGMLFVPSVGGISHSPAEHTRDAHVVAGATVLLGALLAADAASLTD